MLLSVFTVIFFSFCRALTLRAPPQVVANQITFIEWSRNETDPSVWYLVANSPIFDPKTLLGPIVSEGAYGQTSFVFSDLGYYVYGAYTHLPFNNNSLPFASSDIITVIQSNPSKSLTSLDASNTDARGSQRVFKRGTTFFTIFSTEIDMSGDGGDFPSTSSDRQSTEDIPPSSTAPPTTNPATTDISSHPSPPLITQNTAKTISVPSPPPPTPSLTPDTTTESIRTSRTTPTTANITINTSSLPSLISTQNLTSSSSILSSAPTATMTDVVAVSKSKDKEAILIGVIVPVAFLLLLTGVFVVRRRRLRSSQNVPGGERKTGVSPFTERQGVAVSSAKSLPSDASLLSSRVDPSPTKSSGSPVFPSSTMTGRQQWLQSHMNELIAALQATLAAANESAIDGNADLRTEIARLGQLLQSDWALGLTDEPPPSYATLLRGPSRRDGAPEMRVSETLGTDVSEV